MKGADIIKVAPERYSSTIEYADNSIAQALRGVAQVHLADLGTRVFYTQYGGFDVHANEVETQNKLWLDVSGAVSDFFADLREHDASENVVMLVFTEFGRRVRDNGNGTDHGSGGGSFLIGDRVKGGMYAEYPVARAGEAAGRRPALQLRLSRACIRAYSTSGWGWMLRRLWTGLMSRLIS